MAAVVVDQSLFAVVKSTQWQWLEIYDKKQIIVMFGVLIRLSGKQKAIFLDKSGWAVAMCCSK